MKAYTVRCEWDSTGLWVATVPELGVTTAENSIGQSGTYSKER
jgi:hypothetical protein